MNTMGMTAGIVRMLGAVVAVVALIVVLVRGVSRLSLTCNAVRVFASNR